MAVDSNSLILHKAIHLPKELKVNLPSFLVVGKRKPKNLWLNLNGYRNWPFHQNNDLKKQFTEAVSEMLPVIHFEKIEIEYRVFFKTKRRTDVANVCSVVDKFFCDTLVSAGIINDDDYTVLSKVSYIYGGIDKDNPRVEATIKEIDD